MKILVPVDASDAALAPIGYLEALARSGVRLEVLVMNVQPRFHRHVAQFTSRAARAGVRAERSRAAMARAIEALSLANMPFRAFAEVGLPAQRIAAVAEREQVDEVVMGVGRHPAWLRSIFRPGTCRRRCDATIISQPLDRPRAISCRSTCSRTRI